MIIIKCKKCGAVEEHHGTPINLQMLDNDRKTIERHCYNCINKLKMQLLGYKKYKLEKLKDEIVRGVFDGTFSASTPPVSRNDVDNLLRVSWQCLQGDTSVREQLEANKRFCKDRLPSSKADEVINNLLGEQLEIYELEKEIANLQLQERQTEQVS